MTDTILTIDTSLLRSMMSVATPIELMWTRPCDGMPILKSLSQLAKEIEKLNPNALVSVESKREGHIWDGSARHMNADLDARYLKMTSAQAVITDFNGITIFTR